MFANDIYNSLKKQLQVSSPSTKCIVIYDEVGFCLIQNLKTENASKNNINIVYYINIWEFGKLWQS